MKPFAFRLALPTSTLLAGAGSAFGHEGEHVYAWSFDPLVLSLLAISGGLYARGLAALWGNAGRGRGVRSSDALCFFAGWLATAAALVTPLDTLGAELFSAHMVQHEVLMLVAAPLLVLGRPLAVWAWALSPPMRKRLPALLARPGIAVPWRFVTAPFAAWALHAAALWLWHVPVLFDAALRSDGIHTLQHASFLVSALLFWWTCLAPLRAPGVHLGAMLSLFTTMLHTGALGALLAFSQTIWYPVYGERPAAFGLTPLEDQQLGGLIMWVPGGAAYLVAGIVLLARALEQRERWRVRA